MKDTGAREGNDATPRLFRFLEVAAALCLGGIHHRSA